MQYWQLSIQRNIFAANAFHIHTSTAGNHHVGYGTSQFLFVLGTNPVPIGMKMDRDASTNTPQTSRQMEGRAPRVHRVPPEMFSNTS